MSQIPVGSAKQEFTTEESRHAPCEEDRIPSSHRGSQAASRK
jgi:hypothetical protein